MKNNRKEMNGSAREPKNGVYIGYVVRWRCWSKVEVWRYGTTVYNYTVVHHSQGKNEQ